MHPVAVPSTLGPAAVELRGFFKKHAAHLDTVEAVLWGAPHECRALDCASEVSELDAYVVICLPKSVAPHVSGPLLCPVHSSLLRKRRGPEGDQFSLRSSSIVILSQKGDHILGVIPRASLQNRSALEAYSSAPLSASVGEHAASRFSSAPQAELRNATVHRLVAKHAASVAITQGQNSPFSLPIIDSIWLTRLDSRFPDSSTPSYLTGLLRVCEEYELAGSLSSKHGDQHNRGARGESVDSRRSTLTDILLGAAGSVDLLDL